MVVALGIDFEDIIHTPAYRNLDDPGSTSVDLDRAATQILELFDRYDVTATFFVVAEIAKSHPKTIRRIAAHGHEIASHTWSHCSLDDVDNDKRIKEIRRSKEVLEEVTVEQVEGIRAPTCRIDDAVYESVAEEGYSYSSSVMPSVPIPGFYSTEYTFSDVTNVSTRSGDLPEVPLSVHPTLRLPLSGAWMRLLGRAYTLQGIRATLRGDKHVVTYSHPWEFEDLWDTPLPIRSRFRTGSWMGETYKSILKFDAEFCTVGNLVERSTPTQEYTIPGE